MSQGFLPAFTRFLTGFLVVSLYYLPRVKPELGFTWETGHLHYLAPLALLPLVGISYAVLSLRHHRRVPVPGFIFAAAVMLSVVVAVWAQGFAPAPLRSALIVALPWLLVPILLQEMTVDRDRRSLRAVAGGLLALTLADALVQHFFSLPSLTACYEQNPLAVQTHFGLVSDPIGIEDLRARIVAEEPFAHFAGISNTLAIAIVILGGFAWAAHFNFLAWFAGISFLVLFFDSSSFPFVSTKGALLAALAGCTVTLVRFRPWKIVIAGVLLSLFLSSTTAKEKIGILDVPSVDFRLSYWQTARHMSESMGPVGVGQYHRFAEMARVDGGHFALSPHNGFLKAMAELGLPAALAFMAWLASLFAGERRVREDPGAPRRSFIWGASIAILFVVLSPYNDMMLFRYIVSEGHLVTAWPIADVVGRLCGIGIFLLTVWSCLHIRGTLRPSGYVFAATAWLLHVFVDISLFSPGIVVLVAILAALGWQRFSVPTRWSWIGFPVVCLMALIGMVTVRQTTIENDPAQLKKLYLSGEWPLDGEESKALFEVWSRLDPANPFPPQYLRETSVAEESRRWVHRELATSPADPRRIYEVGRWLYNNQAESDIVLAQLRRARDLDDIETLARYRLSDDQRNRLNEMVRQLEDESLN